MSGLPVNIVVEDIPSELVARQLLGEAGLRSGPTYGKQGFGYIKKGLKGFNAAALHGRWLVLTDLDENPCAATLASAWLAGAQPATGLCFRVAIREIESWLLGDIEGLHAFFHIRSRIESLYTRLAAPDNLADPKAELLELAAKSRSAQIRDAMVFRDPQRGFLPGPDYNGVLARFILNGWNPERASTRSVSLRRARDRIRNW